MSSLKRLLIILTLFLSTFSGRSQDYLDSLWQVWSDAAEPDSVRLRALYYFTWNGYLFVDPDSAFYYAQMHYDYAENKGIKEEMASALNVQGATFYIQGDYDQAVNYYTKSLNIQEEIGNKKGMAISFNNIGNIYYDQGNLAQAIDFYTKSLKYEEEVGSTEGIAASLSNIAMIYDDQEDYDQALDYYLKSLKLDEEVGNKDGMAATLNNVGAIYDDQKDYSKAMDYFSKSLKLYREVDDQYGIASSLSNIGRIYKYQGDAEKIKGNEVTSDENYAMALDYYDQCLQIYKEIEYLKGEAIAYNYIGAVYSEQENFDQALLYSNKGLKLAREIGAAGETQEAAQNLWGIYKGLGNYKSALEMHELFISTRDTILSEENQRVVLEQEYKYNYEKQAVADSIKNAEQEKVNQAKLEVEKAKSAAQKRQNIYLFAGLSLVALFGVFMFNRFRVTRKQRDIIDKQKSEVESQKKELESTHQQLEEHHKEISDSIMYAKRIQEAIMPSLNSMDAALKDGFVLYLPKDVVAGDFFWMEQVDDVTYYAAADCTGHGVPGAMVSVVCSNALNKALLEEGIRGTGQLLDRTREIVIDRLTKSGEEVKDGMDISLCALNLKTKELKWAGANNPLWVLRKGAEGFEEIKANKQPIGKYADPKPFTEHSLELNEGDMIYVFTDGYQDQFGGPKGKKFKANQLKDIIITNQALSMDDQMKLLKSKFMEWKGEIEQIDDVCIIGVRV